MALDPYDLALTKLTRNADRDRSDVEYLGTVVPLDVAVLRERYQNEMRSYVGVPEREDLTLELWIDIIQEAQRRGRPRSKTNEASSPYQQAMRGRQTPGPWPHACH